MNRTQLSLLAVVLLLPGLPLQAQDNKITLTVRLPASAALEIDGVKTQVTGEVRTFVSPPVEVGKTYSYILSATWSEGAKKYVAKKELSVEAGKTYDVDLRKDAKEETAAAAPKKEEKPAPMPVVKKEEKPTPPTAPKKEETPKTEVAKAAPNVPATKPAPVTGKLLVPYVPTPQEVVDKMMELAEVTKNDVVYDLGCGDGRIVVTAAKKCGAKGMGVDLNPERVAESKANVKKEGVDKLVEIRQGDVLTTDVSPASVVMLYLLPEVNLKLMPNLKSQLKKGSRIVSHDFDMGDWQPLKKVDVTDKDGVDHTLYLWKIE